MVSADDVIPYMRRVQAVERELRELGLLWQMIESAAAISCPQDVQTILPTLVQTRERFDELQRRVVRSLAEENLAQLQDELAAKAQCAIDILIRNLFERTADVGFLATDNVIREFCATPQQDRAALRHAMQNRLREYCAKYTVYDDIIVLDTAGNVLVRLDDTAELAASTDSIVQAALAAHGYVERFNRSDLVSGTRPGLLYANRIEDGEGTVLGVLVLRFRFEDEMQRIFSSIADRHQQYALVLLDKDNRVIASNDPGHVPLDTEIRPACAGGVDLLAFAGREYLAISCETHGYQNYRGPGWRAHAIVSLLTAFHTRSTDRGAAELTLDNGQLKALQLEADAINRNLRRVVWNGRLMAGNGDTARLKAVLTQVNQAGVRTSERVRLAVGDLHTTSLDRACRQTTEIARLAADIMDRNLYERANDCRWWALSPVLRRVLASPETEASARELNGVLETINGLYTVYRRLVAFDATGTIRGVSNDNPGHSLLGGAMAPDLLAATRSLSGTQQYAVTPFGASALSDDEASYTYLAAVHGERGEFAGGIAIVFHTIREFSAMLSDVMGDRKGFTAFVDESGAVLACSSAQYPTGSRLPFDGNADIGHIGKEQFAVARTRAAGYREFKTSDGYDNRVSVVVALRLGCSERRHAERMPAVSTSAIAIDRSRVMEVAIVQVANARYALPAHRVVIACTPARIVQAPNANHNCMGLMQIDTPAGRAVVPVISARRVFGIAHPPRATDGIAVVLRRVENERPTMAFWVDDVVAVQEIAHDAMQETPEGIRSDTQLVIAVFDQQDAKHPKLVQLIDADRLELLGRQPADAATGVAAAAPPTAATAAAPVRTHAARQAVRA
jgi:chemotaxis signal transduction protein